MENQIKVQKIAIDDPIDMQYAINILGGDDNLYFMMLEQLEARSMNKVMLDLPKAIDDKDWTSMKFLAHSLKGASAYAGAGRIHFSCYYIQLLYETK